MKKVVSLLLALVLCLSLAACGGSGDNASGGSELTHTCSGEWVVKEEATCKKAGTRQRTCSCGEVTTETIPILAHTYAEGSCTACGAKDPNYVPPYSTGLTFESKGDGTCVVTGIGTCTDTDIVIPEKADNGDLVTKIGYQAFRKTNITSVFIPEGVTHIESSAFERCENLESVTIPASIIRIGGDAFVFCYKLSRVYISDLEAWCKMEIGEGYYSPGQPMIYGKANLYLNGELVTDLVIPEGITTLGYSAFLGCSSIVSVTIPESVTSFEDYVFSTCENLVSVTVPKSVTSFGEGVFGLCTKLSSVTFSAEVLPTFKGYPFWDCPALKTVCVADALVSEYAKLPDWEQIADKIILESTGGPTGPSEFSDGLEFTSYGNGTCYVSGRGSCTDTVIKIPETSPTGDRVIEIGENAFYRYCADIASIVVPDTVTKLGDHAFAGCTSLQSLDLPASITLGYAYMLYENNTLTVLTVRCEELLPWPLDVIIRPGVTYLENATIYVPAELVEEYKTASGWSQFVDKIQAITE